MKMENNAKNLKLIEHLKELKRRIIICVLAFISATCIAYLFVEDIYSFLVIPLADSITDEAGRRMIYTGLAEAFITYIKLSVFAGIIISFPVLAWQIYAFSAPGLYSHEKKFFIPYLFISPALFVGGAAFVYYFLFPVAWKFFLSFEMPAQQGSMTIVLEARVSEYLSLVTAMILAFGITFQLPLVIILLVKLGLVDISQLKRFRKYSVVLILVISAFLTPPDILSQIALATPLYLLYEFSIIFCRFMEKKKTDA